MSTTKKGFYLADMNKTSDLLPAIGQKVYFYNTVMKQIWEGIYGVGKHVDADAMWQCSVGSIYNKYVTHWEPNN